MKTAYSPSASAVESVSRVSRILAPTDFSPLSKAVVDATVTMAMASPGASVTVVHVVDPTAPLDEGWGSDVSSLPHDALPSCINRADGVMRELRCEYGHHEALETRIVSGSAARVICDMAKDEGYDLIVMSSHGHMGLARVLIGSVAEQVVQEAPCAVLVAKAARNQAGELSPGQPPFRFARILVGYDHRAGARHALDMARALGSQEEGHITLVHALETTPCFPQSKASAEACAICVQEAAERLAAVRARGLPEAADWDLRVEIGEPWDVIVKMAKETSSDLIVVGPHEHTRWGHSYVGSTAQWVVRLAPCPVLVVK